MLPSPTDTVNIFPIRFAQKRRGACRWEVVPAAPDAALPPLGWQLAGPALRLDLLAPAEADDLLQLLATRAGALPPDRAHRLEQLLARTPRDPQTLPPLDLDPYYPTPPTPEERANLAPRLTAAALAVSEACVNVGLGRPTWLATGGKGLHGHLQALPDVPPHPDILRALLPLIQQAGRLAGVPLLADHRDTAIRTPGSIYFDTSLWEKGASGRGSVWSLEGDARGKHLRADLPSGSPADSATLIRAIQAAPNPTVRPFSPPSITGTERGSGTWRRLGAHTNDPHCPGCGKLDGRSCRVSPEGDRIRCYRLDRSFPFPTPSAHPDIDDVDRRRYLAAAAAFAASLPGDQNRQRAGILGRASRCASVFYQAECLHGDPLGIDTYRCQRGQLCPACADRIKWMRQSWLREMWPEGTYQLLTLDLPAGTAPDEARRIARVAMRRLKRLVPKNDARYFISPARVAIISRKIGPHAAATIAKFGGFTHTQGTREAAIALATAAEPARAAYLDTLIEQPTKLGIEPWAARVHHTAAPRILGLPWPSPKKLTEWLKAKAKAEGRPERFHRPDGALCCGHPPETPIVLSLVSAETGVILDKRIYGMSLPWSDAQIAYLLDHPPHT